MWSRKSTKHQNRGPVGTEAVALENMKRNRKDFGYPAQGFVTPIEHSLLYAMISEPTLYPENVVKDQISEEDFTVYLLGKQVSKEPVISYAQLSAILTLSAEKWPPQQQQDDSQHAAPTSVPQILCKALLQCVVRHAEQHNLDREAEVQELLAPVERLATKRDAKTELAVILPIYIGMGATLVTANPLPLWVGATVTNVMSSRVIAQEGERQNMSSIASETNRMADVEKASLLDESEDL